LFVVFCIGSGCRFGDSSPEVDCAKGFPSWTLPSNAAVIAVKIHSFLRTTPVFFTACLDKERYRHQSLDEEVVGHDCLVGWLISGIQNSKLLLCVYLAAFRKQSVNVIGFIPLRLHDDEGIHRGCMNSLLAS
jgi:hypothetical protein